MIFLRRVGMRFRVKIWHTYRVTLNLIWGKFTIFLDTCEQLGEFFSQF